MKPSLLLLSMLFLISSCSYQTAGGLQGSSGYKQKFADRIDEGSTHMKSTYFTSWERTADGHYVFKQYYTPYDTLTDYISYSKPINDPKYLDGPSKRWYDDGRLCWERYYENGKEVGVWKEYSFRDGRLKEEAVYDSTTNRSFHTIYAGEGYKAETFFKKKVVINDDPFLESYKRDGPFEVFDEDGTLVAEGECEMGEMASKTVYDEEAYPNSEYTEETMPTFISADCEGLEKDKLKACSDQAMLVKVYIV